MSMKYRIRDTNTGELVEQSDMLLLSPCGTRILMYRGSELFRVQGFRPEFEVAPGVYVGDYVLQYCDKIPFVYVVESHHRMYDIVNGHHISLNIVNDFEVIQCRN